MAAAAPSPGSGSPDTHESGEPSPGPASPTARASEAPSGAEGCGSCSEETLAGTTPEAWELSGCSGAEDGKEQSGGARQPWQEEPPMAAAVLLARCKGTFDLTRRKPRCFVKFSEMEKMANIQAAINEIKLKTEILQFEKETADIVHPFYIGNKCKILQDMNRHLEAILKEKRTLRKRLIKPRYEEGLPIAAAFHRSIVELLTDAVAFIEKLESHLQAVKTIPRIPSIMKNMDTALTRTEVLVMELEELADQILKWRERQKEAYSGDTCSTAELDFGLSLT